MNVLWGGPMPYDPYAPSQQTMFRENDGSIHGNTVSTSFWSTKPELDIEITLVDVPTKIEFTRG